ncbi:MAG: DUF4350 domain-containing protein [Roseivirga sp.]|nr:DUF4350 domain-containing protein [Roseivirga sp.]
MKGDRKYYIMIIGVFLILFLASYFREEPTNYNHTFSHLDKNPYGGYVLKQLMPDLFGDKKVENLNRTLYEIQDQLTPDKNLLVIADRMNMGGEDVEVLLEAVDAGMNAMIITQGAYSLTDTLGFSTSTNEFNYLLNANQDSSMVTFINDRLPEGDFKYKRDAISYYFDDLDSLEYGTIATNLTDRPVAMKVSYGKGNFYFCTTPLAFTNEYLFFENNHEYASTILSFLPRRDMIWSEYYQLGRMEVATPLRVVLTSPSLKLAYLVTIVALILFMVFEAKRKQRIIPIVKPLANTTLQFIGTIANLYLRKKDHWDIAQKRIQYFQEYIHNRYFMSFKKFDHAFFEKLAAKSGNDVIEVKKLFDLIQQIKEKQTVNESELKSLSDKIEAFYGR